MTQEVSSNLVKIIVGIVVAVIVISGIAMLFGSKLNDFFSGVGGDEFIENAGIDENNLGSEGVVEKPMSCESCGKGFISYSRHFNCPVNICEELDRQWKEYSKGEIGCYRSNKYNPSLGFFSYFTRNCISYKL